MTSEVGTPGGGGVIMSVDLEYPTAVGHLQVATSHAAIDIESIVRNVVMDAWAKEDLLKVARSLREATEDADAICNPELVGEKP